MIMCNLTQFQLFIMLLGGLEGILCILEDKLYQGNDNQYCLDEKLFQKTRDQPNDKSGCFKAAVFEYASFQLEDIVQNIKLNLYEFRQAARVAASHGAKIILYPEDAIFIGDTKWMIPVLNEIPNPDTINAHSNNPCDNDHYDQNSTFILKELSCIAKDYNIYVAANFGTRQDCEALMPVGDRECPISGKLLLNTDVVFDDLGNFIKRYRKYNLFLEAFERPPTMEEAFFDTPFGRFGVFTCFDMIFQKPAVNLVEKHQVDTILFPTLWHDELPLLTAIQYQDGWSYRNRVNLMAANLLRHSVGSFGSGIYSGEDAVYTQVNATRSSLIIANIPTHPRSTDVDSDTCFNRQPPKVIKFGSKFEERPSYLQWEYNPDDKIHYLEDYGGSIEVSNGRVSCSLRYKISPDHKFPDRSLALIVRDSNRKHIFHWYEQVCTFATIEGLKSSNYGNKYMEYMTRGLVGFEELRLTIISGSNHVYPIAAYDVNRLIDRKDRTYECHETSENRQNCSLTYKGKSSDKIYSFGMYGRLYAEDK